MSFIEINPDRMEGNFIRRIGNQWMLAAAKKPDGSVNAMTCSWGFAGEIWGRPAFICFIRPQRFTFEFTEASDFITLSFFDGGQKDALNYCGSHSGREGGKLEKAGLHTIVDGEGVYFEESTAVLIGRKLYADFLKEDKFTVPGEAAKNYPGKDYHKVYICGIERALIRG